jgi:hypothetical protein
LLTPLADPERLSVNSQMTRLVSGAVPASQFDYQFLRFHSGRFGTNALANLASGTNAEARQRALRMQEAKLPSYFGLGGPNPAITEAAFSHATVYPAGAQLPTDFRNADWSGQPTFPPLDCLTNGGSCDIYLVAYGGAGKSAVIVRRSRTDDDTTSAFLGDVGRLFQRGADGKWKETGMFNHLNCPGVVAALREGKFVESPPEHDDLTVAGVRLRFASNVRTQDECTVNLHPPRAPKQTPDATGPLQMGPVLSGPH